MSLCLCGEEVALSHYTRRHPTVLQTFQMVHGVWPPFLVGGIAGALRRAAAQFFDSLVANVEHVT